eukprot:TRINITY_DN24456_c0_g1_i1.p1 TRINITY_DN24456_c0_g1~~TRINITY_DN24456_c0_g1_i1.p1  ORF type:complete len:535 (-),score=107.83 TRINITY_DN24456_c0_g1_i1:138-1742(-)
MKFTRLFKRKPTKTPIEVVTLDQSDDEVPQPQSTPVSPRHHSDGNLHLAAAAERPATTDEEIRPVCSPLRPSTAGADTFSVWSPSAPRIGSAMQGPRESATVVDDDAALEAPPCDEPVQSVDFPQLNLDLPANEICARVEEAFGLTIASSLRSAKWDKRVHALKTIGAVLKGLDLGGIGGRPSAMKGLRLRDGQSCWRATCEVLSRSLCDKVMPVRLASHELFTLTFGHSEGADVSREELHFAMNSLLGHIIASLGDSNLRVHESARSCVLFCAQAPQLLGLGPVLKLLCAHLESVGKRERMKTHFGVLDTVNFLLGQFPLIERSNGEDNRYQWTKEQVAPFISSGMDDALGPRVRSIAVTLAVTLRVAFGSHAVEPVVAGLRPAVQSLLREKFAELDAAEDTDADDDDFVAPSGDIMAGLVVCGSAIRAPVPPTPCSLPGCANAHDEDTFMDEILEETGHAFRSSSSSLCLPQPSMCGGRSRSFGCESGLGPSALEEIDAELQSIGMLSPSDNTENKTDDGKVRFNMAAIEVF